MFTAYCPELDVASCGHSSDEAKKNLKEVIGIQLEETSKLDTSMQIGVVLFNLDNSRL
ncbi:MAG: type II toxin-antitoxin system HicB family antitoxin [Euryarchaeota archaeon]|nr:type II toxin-antitoxin system HicB family antitoxin [Euryarchaeota archaeon]